MMDPMIGKKPEEEEKTGILILMSLTFLHPKERKAPVPPEKGAGDDDDDFKMDDEFKDLFNDKDFDDDEDDDY